MATSTIKRRFENANVKLSVDTTNQVQWRNETYPRLWFTYKKDTKELLVNIETIDGFIGSNKLIAQF